MKLLCLVNHAAPFHVGGSEKVIDQITSSMRDDYNIDCHIITKFTHQTKAVYNGITIEKCLPTPEEFLNQVEEAQADHIFTYSDCFGHWPTLLREAERIKSKKSIALVGMNQMYSDQNMRSMFFNKHRLFNVITHSDNYQDFRYCHEKKIPVTVIPNGINMNEFEDQGFSFREKYNIETPNIILCVSNFFPGKGQDHLLCVLKKLAERDKSFTAVFICTKVSFFVANNLMQRFEVLLRRNSSFPFRFLKDIPRSHTVQAFREADVFAFPSQQEVAPLVILESMATSTPWVALNVGNIPTLPGGIVIPGRRKIKDQYQYDENMYEEFTAALDKILKDKAFAHKLGDEGHNYIDKYLNWEKLKSQYYKVFTS